MIDFPEKGERDYWYVMCDKCGKDWHFSENYGQPIYCQYCGKKLKLEKWQKWLI